MENLPENYNQTLLNLKERIKLAQYKSLSTVNSEMILMYLDFGKIFSEKLKSGWGESIIDNISKDLQTEYAGVKGFSSRNLRRMKLIYDEICHNPIWTQAVSKIPWGHSNLIFAKVKKKRKELFIYKNR